MVHYRESQSFAKNPALWIAIAISAVVLWQALSIVLVRESSAAWTAVGVQALVLAWMLLIRLVTEVRDDGVHLKFHFLWFPKTFPWDEIERAEAVSYRPIVDYGGWGIRWGWHGRAWNVYGSQGVRLHLYNGKNFLIGSQEPDRLAAAIRDRLAVTPRLSAH